MVMWVYSFLQTSAVAIALLWAFISILGFILSLLFAYGMFYTTGEYDVTALVQITTKIAALGDREKQVTKETLLVKFRYYSMAIDYIASVYKIIPI